MENISTRLHKKHIRSSVDYAYENEIRAKICGNTQIFALIGCFGVCIIAELDEMPYLCGRKSVEIHKNTTLFYVIRTQTIPTKAHQRERKRYGENRYRYPSLR